LQRAGLVEAMTAVVAERGFRGATVEQVIRRAKASRRAFYAHFCSIEDCFDAVLDDAAERTAALIADGFADASSWEEGVREALARLLVFLDSEPELARVWMIEAIAAGSWAFERRERHVATLRRLIVDQRPPPSRRLPYALTDSRDAESLAESQTVIAVMAAAIGMVHTHLLARREQPLIGLLGQMMGVVSAPYLDAGAVAREVLAGERRARELLATRYPLARAQIPDASVEVPPALGDPRSHRARRCLCYVAAHPGASNRAVADAAGIRSHTQASEVLRRLQDLGLLEKQAQRAGLPNAWRVTEHGRVVAGALERSAVETVAARGLTS